MLGKKEKCQLEIEAVDFDHTITVNGNQTTVHEAIAKCYESLIKVHRVGTTTTSKLLHILQPNLFVMWDWEILDYYQQMNQQVQDSGSGYCVFLQAMKEIGKQVSQSFRKVVSPDEVKQQGPTAYLSAMLGYDPPKTMAKYLDEYNWVTITNEIEVPPHWHP